METSSAARKLVQILIASAIQRCRLSGSLCRLTVSLKCYHDSDPSSVRISISDTGVGSSLVEFQDFEFASTDKWDGVLSITTTGIHDKDIHHYRLNVGEAASSSTRLTRLPPTYKNVVTFSGTEVCTSTVEEKSVGVLVAWVVNFVRKILVLKVPNIAMEILVEHINGLGSRSECLLQEIDNVFLPISMSRIEHVVSGLKDYVLKHGNDFTRECQSCFPSRGHLMVGSGLACSTENMRGTGQIMEAVIVIAPESSQPCSWRVSRLNTQVLYYQDFSPCTIPQSSVNALTSIDWKSYGLRLSGIVVDGEGHAVVEWEDLPIFPQITITIHSYQRKVIQPQTRQSTPSNRNLVKKSVKIALDDLKAKHTGLFLSSQAVKIRDYAPDLSRAITGLIISSNDSDFQGDCATLLGLSSDDAGTEELIQDCVREKIIGIIEMNDRKRGIDRDIAPCLFDCEALCELDCPDEEDDGAEDVGILDI